MKLAAFSLVLAGILLAALMPAARSSAQAGDDLTGTHWQLVALGAAGAEIPVVSGSAVTLEFGADNRAAGSGGCNSYGGSYTVAGASIQFSGIASTRMMCADGAVMEQEQSYFAALEAAARYTLSDGELTITYGGRQRLVFAPFNDLANTQWQLVSYGLVGEGIPVDPDSVITLEFDPGDRIGGSGGCNMYGGTYAIAGGRIHFEQVFSTERACLDGLVMEHEQAYFAALAATATYEVSGDELTIAYGDGERLMFTRVQSLSQTQWQLASYGPVGAETPVIAGSAITLEFVDANRAGGSGGCNRYGGHYEAVNDRITFSAITSTKMACVDEGIMAQEMAYFAALAHAAVYELTADQLVITYGNGERLIFAPLSTATTMSR